MTLPIADWQAALDRMDASLRRTVEALDEYHAKWAEALSSPAPRALLPVGDAGRTEDRLNAWDERLKAAAELAASVGKQLEDREAAVGRWRALFAEWQGGIQRGMASDKHPG
jgi:hypothetical protein